MTNGPKLEKLPHFFVRGGGQLGKHSLNGSEPQIKQPFTFKNGPAHLKVCVLGNLKKSRYIAPTARHATSTSIFFILSFSILMKIYMKSFSNLKSSKIMFWKFSGVADPTKANIYNFRRIEKACF